MAVTVTEGADGDYERNVVGIVETLIRDDGEWLYLSSVNLELDLDD